MLDVVVAAWTVSIALLAGSAVAQSQPMPGAPSIPFTPHVQQLNGGSGPATTFQYGTEFVTVNPLGPNGQPNAPYSADAPAEANGSVDHAFRIGRYEVTTGQWGAFFLAADQVRQSTGQAIPYVSFPTYIGGVNGSNMMAPVGGITWRTAAIYCNWLHNNQAVTRDAFMNGAYDVSTFGYVNGNQFTDQLTHNPGARFWIPTMNEVLVSQHYDPNRYGPGQAGYWNYNITQDTQPIYGPPGITINGQPTQANSNWGPADYPGQGFPFGFGISLGAYPNAQSPWGLLDAAGGASEWSERVFRLTGTTPVYRYAHGSAAADGAFGRDALGGYIGESPSSGSYVYGFRIAAAVPAPSAIPCTLAFATCLSLRRSRWRVARPPGADC